MSDIAIKIEGLSKQYRLGQVGTGTVSHDLNRWWHKVRGQEDPYLKIGETNDRSTKGESEYVWAIKDINFEVKKGEVLGIIGKNGAGKSTLLKLLSKVTAPTEGFIKANGRIASLLEVGTGFHPEMTGRENIYMNGTIMGMTKPEITSKLEEIVEFAGIERYIDTPAKRYSSGMTVRLGFAIAAHLEPEILIVDEVLAVGDAEFQKKAIGKMKEVSEGQGRTVLFVSHNMASIQNLCSKVVVMENGTTVFSGDVNSGIQYYMESNSSKVRSNVKERTDRKGKGPLRFSEINIIDKQGNKLSDIFSGSDICINLKISLSDIISNPKFRISIIDQNGITRFICNNYFSKKEKISFSNLNNHIISCKINKFPLPAGNYYINISCNADNGLNDELEHASQIIVAGGDYYNTGIEPGIKDGVLIDHEFEIIEYNEDQFI